MLYDDLMNYRGVDSVREDRIRGKYIAELAYYAVLEQAIGTYGPAGARSIEFYNNDLLGAARDEMAMRASDQGLVQYMPGTGGLVSGFRTPDGGTRGIPDRDTMRELVRRSFLNCEAVRTMVSTHLCATRYRGQAMNDDEIQARTDEELARALNPDEPQSLLNRALENAMTAIDGTDGLGSKYAPRLPVHRPNQDNTRTEDTGRTVRGLKISPLLPELRVLRRSGYMDNLGMSPKQADLRNEEQLLNNNHVLAYDPDKHVLFRPSEGMEAPAIFREGTVVSPAPEWQAMRLQRRNMTVVETGDGEYVNAGVQTQTYRLLRPGRVNEGLNELFRFRMAHILSSHSYQDLNDDDFDAIRRIFDPGKSRSDGTIFGDFERDWNGSMRNAEAYFDYIEHVCSVAEERMPSHDFEIHFEVQRAFSSSDYGRGFVPLMYFTGSRTDEFRRARANSSRYMAVYPYLSYTPKELGHLPVMGDVAPASYSNFVITKQDHRGSATDPNMNNERTNPYVNGRLITADMCRSMKETFDASVDPALARRAGVTTTRVQRAVGETDVEDLSRFIRGDGSVDGDAVIRELVIDMNATKQAAATAFHTEANAALLRRVFNRFADRVAGAPDPGEPHATMDDAMYLFTADGKRGHNLEHFRKDLSEVLEECLVRELRASVGEDVDTFVGTQHVFRNYISSFVNSASRALGDRSLRDVRGDLSTFAEMDGVLDSLVGAVTDPDDRLAIDALKDLYGQGESDTGLTTDPDVPQRIVLKANMLRHASTRLRTGDYNDLLSLLSYSDRAAYEPDASRDFKNLCAPAKQDDAPGTLRLTTYGTYAAVQLFASSAFDILSVADAVQGEDDLDDERDEDESRDETETTAGTVTEEKAWFDAMFARTGGEDDRTLAWIETMYPGDKGSDGEYLPGAKEHAVYVATHPLQVEAMRRAGRVLQSVDDGYSAQRLAVTPQGMIYYNDREGNTLLKIGPVTDEVGYVRPFVMDADENTPGAVQIEKPLVNDNGWPLRDESGMALTDPVPAWVTVDRDIVLAEDGTLMNPVEFCALDTPSLNADPNVEAVPNRFYGVSMKVRNYDGYYHEDFTRRMSFSTYQSGVLENLDRALALYAASRAYDPEQAASVRSTLYTHVSGSALRKAYQTNTTVMLDKHMSMAAHKYLSDLAQSDDTFDGPTREHARVAANMYAMQSREYHGRCVLAKASMDQNVGLFNQARNLQQGRADQVVGEMDRNSLLRTDCMGVRAMIFQDNPIFDPVSTGTARTMGSVAFLSDGAEITRLDAALVTDETADATSRAPMISTGILDVDTGGLDARLCHHPGGQAVDRLELSTNGVRKAVSYVPSMKFAMVNLGYNMEDGYIVAKRAADALGHFRNGSTFVPLAEWDKIGDSESGNKGIVAHIVNTDLTDEDAFMADFTYRYMHLHAFNHSRAGKGGDVAVSVDKAVETWLKSVTSDPGATLESYLMSRPNVADPALMPTAGDIMNTMRTLITEGYIERNELDDEGNEVVRRESYSWKGGERAGKLDELKAQLYATLKEPMTALGYSLKASGAEPFNGSWQSEHAAWQLFMDNPDLDIAVTNVCVCTRSNPSILMNIDEALESDRRALAGHEGEPGFNRETWLAEHGQSVLAVRDSEGTLSYVEGACGRMPVYVDCHYADDKNKDYNKAVHKAGRGYGMQEFYALMAKHSVSSLVPYITANDPVQAKQAAKLNRKIMMNGYAFDMSDPEMKCVTLAGLLGDVELDMASSDNILRVSTSKPGYMFIDMDALAERLVKKLPEDVSQDDVGKALEKIGESQDFTRFMALVNGTAAGDTPSAKVDAGLHDLFLKFAQYGGAFMLESENAAHASPTVDLGFRYHDRDTGEEYVESTALYAGLADGRSAVPLFLSNREVPNADGDVVTSPSEDRLQFKIFKSLLGTAVAGYLAESEHEGGRPYADPAKCHAAAAACTERTRKLYAGIPDEQSLSLERMNNWLKKNMFRTVFPNSLTAVWHGDASLEIDECGLSFEKAKSLQLLRPKAGLSQEDLDKIPDTYEFMAERYEPLTDDDFVLVNRSPGQTTGCIRALRPRIIGPKGDGITIHPALATIFDGDFDGDTVGVINPRTAEGIDASDPEFHELRAAAMAELKGRMSMKANMISKPSFTDVTDASGHKIDYLHPLFIAKNADLAVAMYNMGQPSGDDGRPRAGYDVKAELERVTVAANMIEQLRQCEYDYENAALGRISQEDARKIAGIRLDKVRECLDYFDAKDYGKKIDEKTGTDKATEKDHELADAWRKDVVGDKNAGFKAMYGQARAAYDAGGAVKLDLREVSHIEEASFRKLADAYREMTPYISDPPLMTQGRNAVDVMYNIVRDANISGKGKEPQLNALLQFSGMHRDCSIRRGGDGIGMLGVAKDPDGKFRLTARMEGEDGKPADLFLYRQEDGSYQTSLDGKEMLGAYDPAGRSMSHLRAVSDIKETPFYSATVSNIIAQSDKSDATGIGGSMAQKMQKVLGALGYGELALRISGPVTQKYLDAKQNVKDCEKNLKIGKSILNKVCAGARINELQDSHFEKGGAVHKQVYNGNYTLGEHGLDADEYVAQMSNFLQMMGHEPFSPLDRAQFTACMRHYEETAQYGKDKGLVTVGNPIRKADERGDAVFASIYNGDDVLSYAKVLKRMAESGRGLYSGSGIYDGRVDGARLASKMAAETMPVKVTAYIDRKIKEMAAERSVTDKEAALERVAASLQAGVPKTEPEAVINGVDSVTDGPVRPEKTPEEVDRDIKAAMDATRERCREAGGSMFDGLDDDEYDDVP